MQTIFRLILVIIILILIVSFKPVAREKINWISLDELQTVYAGNPKPIIIDVYTKHCGWDKVMNKETYSNKKVASYINEHFYAVKFNAESSDSAVLGNKKFGFNPAYNANDLAVYLLSGRVGYTTTVLLTSPDAQPAPFSGYLKPSELEPPVKYFGDGVFKNKEFAEYMKEFEGTW